MNALFYPLNAKLRDVVQIVQGFLEPPGLVEFTDEAGGDIDQALAVPFLPGMDAIVVTEARIVLRSYPQNFDIENYNLSENGGNGIFLSVAEPARLHKVEISYDYTPPEGSETTRVVVRAGGEVNALQSGVPLFASPDFGHTAGSMYSATLGGMHFADLGDKRFLLSFPAVLGSAWLIQLASGNELKNLNPIALNPSVNRVVFEALPRNLSVTLAPATDNLTLWQNPGVLLEEAGDQEISFTPLAQKHLSAALEKADANTAALPVPLRFHSDCGSAIRIITKSLVSEYQVSPLSDGVSSLGDGVSPLQLRGDFTALPLSAPAGLLPSKSAMRLTIKMLGRELNAASPEPPLHKPDRGLRVGTERWVAVASAVAPRANESAGSVLEIASVRIYVAASTAAEVVLEIRNDVAHAPGTAAAAPLVAQLTANFCGWYEFELPTPLKVVAGNAPIWLQLRSNNGDVHWFAGASNPADNSRVSTDRGATWGPPHAQLGITGTPLLQLFHRVEDAQLSAPIIRIQRDATILQNNIAAGAQQKSPREYSLAAGALPGAVHAQLAAQSGQGRKTSEFFLFSRSALDLVFDALTLSYDPFSSNATANSSGG